MPKKLSRTINADSATFALLRAIVTAKLATLNAALEDHDVHAHEVRDGWRIEIAQLRIILAQIL